MNRLSRICRESRKGTNFIITLNTAEKDRSTWLDFFFHCCDSRIFAVYTRAASDQVFLPTGCRHVHSWSRSTALIAEKSVPVTLWQEMIFIGTREEVCVVSKEDADAKECILHRWNCLSFQLVIQQKGREPTSRGEVRKRYPTAQSSHWRGNFNLAWKCE